MSTTRREFLSMAGGLSLGVLAGPVRAAAGEDLIRGIVVDTLWEKRKQPDPWFQVRGCMLPGRRALMTLQTIHGSDFYGPVQWMMSSDLGKTWSQPQPIPALGRLEPSDGVFEGVCDVVPTYHPKTKTTLALGHNVFYTEKGFFRQQPRRLSVYAVRDAEGNWSQRKVLPWNDPRGSLIYTCGCGQRIVRPDGDVLVALYFGAGGPRCVAVARYGFDGREMTLKETGQALSLAAGRGLLEPQLVWWKDRAFLTLRAEDERGYVTVGSDGMNWQPIRPWTWDDGEPLTMSTTQQHWLEHSDGLFLVYTRKTAENAKVMRWRAPLFVARVDPEKLCLIRETERVAMPVYGEPEKPETVERMGNFHVFPATREESWITVGTIATPSYEGRTVLGRVRWSKENALVRA